MAKLIIVMIISLFLGCAGNQRVIYPNTIKGALQAKKDGNESEAIRIFTAFANEGDPKAMTSIGMIYHQGEGVERDYNKAFDWYLKAFEKKDGDALNNIGVMFRDGQGVSVNRKIAYLLFLTTHMKGLGNSGTQARANQNLRREVKEQEKEEIRESLCFTLPYFLEMVRNKGEVGDLLNDLLPSDKRKRIKDLNWWLEHEREAMDFECPEPWVYKE